MPIHGFPGNVISATPPSVTPAGASGVFTTEQQMQYQAAGNWPMAATQISRSLRFNSADNANLDRTPASAGNRKTWTWSGWIKRGSLGFQALETVDDGPGEDSIAFLAGDTIRVYMSPVAGNGTITTGVFRDVSAWYHIVVAVDTTQATEANRTIIYVNGVNATSSSSNYITQNSDTKFNGVFPHYLGRYANQVQPSGNFDGYMTEVHFIDGLALTPASFGQTNSNTGVWEPRQYTGPYGTNGFYLNFSDNSNTTSTTLGKDYSGNGNNWTPNNFSVTAGVGNDSMVDTPTPYGTDTGAGGEVRGNYCTLNPLVALSGTRSFSNGNLDVSVTTNNVNTFGTFAIPSSGKWYWEYQITTINDSPMGGVANLTNNTAAANFVGYRTNGNKLVDDVGTSYGATYTTTDIIGVAVDVDGGTITFYKNGSSQGAITYACGGLFPVVRSNTQPNVFILNFGQRPFAYTAPSGFKALCTQNLPTPTIGATSTTQAGDYFNTVLYTGTGASRSVTGVGFQPDLLWIKNRVGTASHNLADAVRGITNGLASNSTAAEYSMGFTSFDADGFSMGAGNSQINTNNDTYVAWNWKANGAGSTNTSGTITSTVSANTTAGFSIVTYTGTGANATVGHGLGVAPSMIITKNRSTTSQWAVYHSRLTSANYALLLDLTNAEDFSSAYWNSTAPTSTLFSVGGAASTNGSGNNMVAYCFTPVAGYSAFGGYTGNGSSDGTFVYTGFRPACIIFKVSDGTASWLIHDNKRNTYNVVDKKLFPNSSDAEATADVADFLSNGFKLRGTNTQFNGNGFKYIYAAFAEFPFKYTLAR